MNNDSPSVPRPVRLIFGRTIVPGMTIINTCPGREFGCGIQASNHARGHTHERTVLDMEQAGSARSLILLDEDGEQQPDYIDGSATVRVYVDTPVTTPPPAVAEPMTPMWTFEGEQLAQLLGALDPTTGIYKIRFALDEGTLKVKVNEDTWSPGKPADGEARP